MCLHTRMTKHYQNIWTANHYKCKKSPPFFFSFIIKRLFNVYKIFNCIESFRYIKHPANLEIHAEVNEHPIIQLFYLFQIKRNAEHWEKTQGQGRLRGDYPQIFLEKKSNSNSTIIYKYGNLQKKIINHKSVEYYKKKLKGS